MTINRNELIEEISEKRNEINFSFDEISNLLERLMSIAYESNSSKNKNISTFNNNEIKRIKKTINGYINGIKMKQSRIFTIYQLIK